jgi:hypothetical protein
MLPWSILFERLTLFRNGGSVCRYFRWKRSVKGNKTPRSGQEVDVEQT